MKKLAFVFAGLLMLISTAVFAEEHADAALDHAKMAVVHGKAGHGPVLVEHATEALKHAKAAVDAAASAESKTHLSAAVTSLGQAIEHGNMGKGHEEMATKAAEEAVGHIEAGNK